LVLAEQIGPPKFGRHSDQRPASLRTNALPEAIRPVIVEHLAKYMGSGPDA
jgi:hypothetical protein